MRRILFIIIALIVSLVMTSSPAVAKPKINSITSDGEYIFQDSSILNGCYYNLTSVWVEFTGVCYWICTEYEDGSISQSSVIDGVADIYQYDGSLVLLEENIPFSISEEFLDLTGDKTYKTDAGYYQIMVDVTWIEMDEYYYHREIEKRFAEKYDLKKNGKWSWWYKAGKCHDRASSNKY